MEQILTQKFLKVPEYAKKYGLPESRVRQMCPSRASVLMISLFIRAMPSLPPGQAPVRLDLRRRALADTGSVRSLYRIHRSKSIAIGSAASFNSLQGKTKGSLRSGTTPCEME